MSDEHTNAERPYQVCLYVGPQVPVLEGVRVVDLTPAERTPEATIAALESAELTPADLRSRVLFVADGDETYRDAAVMVYAALLGFAKRRLDVAFTVNGESLAMDQFDAALRRTVTTVRPDVLPDTVQVGGSERADLLRVDAAAGLTAATVTAIRFARRLRYVPPATAAEAIPMLVAIGALRARGQVDKLPLLCDGTEPAPSDPSVPDNAGVCLDTLRRAGEDIRRALRSDTRGALAPAMEENLYAALVEADAKPIEEILIRLGAHSKVVYLPAKAGTPEHEQGVTVATEVWHCPRPARHTNGDANPSSRVIVKADVALFQCFRCDPERVGPLRLVMDTLTKTGAEAAAWIMSE